MTSFLPKLVIFALILALSLVGAVFFLKPFFLPYSTKIEKRSVSISPKWVNQAQFAGVFVAIEKGFYKNLGLEVKVNEFTEKSNPIEDLLEGKTDFALASANTTLITYSKTKSIKALAATYQISPFVIVSLAEKNIVSPTDLKNKTVGIKGGPGSETESIYELIFRSSGLSFDKIDKKYYPFTTSEYEDLVAKRFDAIGLYRTDQLYMFEKNSVPYNLLYPEQYGSATYNDVLIAKDEFVNQNPNTTRAFVKATIQGWKYALENVDEAVKITMKYITQEKYKDKDYQKFILNQSKPLIQPFENQSIGFMDLSHWQKYANSLKKLNLIDQNINVENIYTNAYLP